MPESIGQPLTRVDGRLKVTGRAPYSAEHPVPNAAHAVLVLSAIPKGRVVSIDTRAAMRHKGVLAVMTPQNTPKLPQKPNATHEARPTDRKLTLLQDDLVHYANQPIGVVIAETFEQATEAAALLDVRYAAEPHEVNLERNLSKAFAPQKAGGGGDPADSHRGDAAGALAGGDTRVEQVYDTPFETHNPMEPHATIAVWDGPDKLTLYDATQGIFGDRERVAGMLGIEPDNVRVISPYLGGGFGSKGPTWSHVVLTAMAAQRVKRPVKLVLSRRQMFGPIGFRSRTRQTVALSAKPDGALSGLKFDTVCQTSEFDDFTEAASVPPRMMYTCANVDTSHRLIRANIGTPSFMRAPGEAPGTYGMECAMDELAYALKMDPLALRLKNYAEQDPEKNRPWSSKSLRECYRIGAERFRWSRRTMEPRSMRDGHALIGWGMATAVYPTRRSASSAMARLRDDGSLLVESGTQDLGTGTYTVMTQIAADALGVAPARVTFRLGDTEFPETPVSGGSQTAASTGSAVHLAAKALREKLVQMAVSDARSPMYPAGAQDVLIEDGRMILRGDRTRGETLQAMLTRQGQKQVEAHGDAKPGEERERYSMYAFGAQFAEVRVDADLGQLRVSRMVGVFGAGRILNAKTARSQFIGGMVWGIGMALYEDTVMDERLGRFVNNNLAEYHIPVNADVPAIDASWVDEVDEHVNPIGVKGIGEIGITGATAAIANAVYHATGKRVRDLPITLDKVLA
jgi:xanthine dehydrogenase YagR molybdenum-binding subunit